MRLVTKTNALRFLAVLCVFLLILNFFGFKSESSLTFSNLSFRRVHKYAHVPRNNSGARLPNAPLTLLKDKHFDRNESTVIENGTSIPQDLNQTYNKNLSKTKPSSGNTTIKNLKTHKFMYLKPANRIQCSEPDLREVGPIMPNTTLESLDVIEAELGPLLRPGGAFEPEDCIAKHHVAIVVPFRDRYAHLSVFLRNLHPFLMKQHIAYRIYIIEQTNGKPFNRASLMNIGFLEALKMYQWDCFIFHDVDLLPLDDRNIYNCPRQPRHMSVAIDTLNFKLPYRTIFGGVSAMTRKQFQAVNGFSNSYFGWGGEDDDMSNRLKHENFFISRYPVNIARYMMLKHQKEKANPKRYENLVNGIGKMDLDGLNSIEYNIYSIKEFPTFTWLLAELKNK